MGTRSADHMTPLYPQKFALTSPTGGGRSVGIVRVRTKATEISTLQHVPLLLHGERLIDNQFLSTCSPTCLQLL